MVEPSRSVALTGSGGILGRALVRVLTDRGHWVFPLRGEGPNQTFRLGTKPVIPPGTGALIHCAHDFSLLSFRDMARVNGDGSVALFDAAIQAGVRRILFVSSMAAHENCRSQYGRVKLRVEQAALERGVIVVRPGMIWGSQPEGGVLGGLKKLARAPLIPLVGMGKQVLYLVHVDDLAAAIARIVEASAPPSRPAVLACPRPLTLRQILRSLSPSAGRPFVPIPWPLLWVPLRLCEAARIRPPFRSDSLISLLNQDPSPDFGIQTEMGLTMRDFLSDSQEKRIETGAGT